MPGGVFSSPEHLPPPLKKVKKPQEELDKASERLARPRTVPEPKDGDRLAPHVVKPFKEIEVGLNRLYTQAMEQDRRRREKAEEEKNKPTKDPVKMSEDELSESVQRQYSRAMDLQKQNQEKLRQKYLFSPPTTPRKHSDETTKRLYADTLEKKKRMHEKMHDKYVLATEPKCKKLTLDEIKMSGSRLSSKPGSAA